LSLIGSVCLWFCFLFRPFFYSFLPCAWTLGNIVLVVFLPYQCRDFNSLLMLLVLLAPCSPRRSPPTTTGSGLSPPSEFSPRLFPFCLQLLESASHRSPPPLVFSDSSWSTHDQHFHVTLPSCPAHLSFRTPAMPPSSPLPPKPPPFFLVCSSSLLLLRNRNHFHIWMVQFQRPLLF